MTNKAKQIVQFHLFIEYNSNSDDIFNDLIELLDQPTFTGQTQDTVN